MIYPSLRHSWRLPLAALLVLLVLYLSATALLVRNQCAIGASHTSS